MKPEQFETIVDSISNKLDDIARKVVETTHNEFINNFDSQSFDGKRWPEVERNESSKGWKAKYSKYSGNPPLVETGNLKEALRNSIKGTTWRDMRIELDNDYAEFVNAGTKNIPARTFIGMTNTLEDKLKKIIEEEITNMFNQ